MIAHIQRDSLQILLSTAILLLTSGCSDYGSAISDANALQQVGDMLVVGARKRGLNHLREWSNLHDAYELTQQGYNNFTFAELRDRVHINFLEIENFESENVILFRLKRTLERRELLPMEASVNLRVRTAFNELGEGFADGKLGIRDSIETEGREQPDRSE